MVRPMPEGYSAGYQYGVYNSAPVAVGLFLAITALVGLCAHHGSKSTKNPNNNMKTESCNEIKKKTTTASAAITAKFDAADSDNNNNNKAADVEEAVELRLVVPPRSPLMRSPLTSPLRSPLMRSALTSPLRSPLMRSPKRLFSAIGDKVSSPFTRRRRRHRKRDNNTNTDDEEEYSEFTSEDEEEEEEGVWQRNILMGDKCRPLEFSGVIYYDSYGKRVDEIPRSPRAAPMSPNTNMNIPFPPNSPLRTTTAFSFPTVSKHRDTTTTIKF